MWVIQRMKKLIHETLLKINAMKKSLLRMMGLLIALTYAILLRVQWQIVPLK